MAAQDAPQPVSISASPAKIRELESKFTAILVTSSLLSKRGIPCTVNNLKSQVGKMLNNKPLTLLDLQLIRQIVPTLCSIQTVQPKDTRNDSNVHADDNDDADSMHDHNVYQLHFSFPITPNNIANVVQRFKDAVSNIKKRKLPPQSNRGQAPPRKRRKLQSNHNNAVQAEDEEESIQLNLQPLPPKDISRHTHKIRAVTFEPLSFLEKSKQFEFWSDGNIVSHKLLPAKAAKYDHLNLVDNNNNSSNNQNEQNAPTPIRIETIPAVLVHALKELKGIDIANKLYSHQVNAINSICRGYHNIIATPTSSGKSYCYNIPVLSHIIHCMQQNKKSQNFYLFPTKALAQDQLRSLKTIVSKLNSSQDMHGRIECATYDGDTPHHERHRILTECHVILTNPDIIHQTLLPKHARYKQLFSNTSFVVIDEAHSYYSVFGSHFANILRRFKRICAMYATYPLFIGCSATINNPLQHFASLTGINPRDINVVDCKQDGSAMGKKLFIFWQPPLKCSKHRNANSKKPVPQKGHKRSSNDNRNSNKQHNGNNENKKDQYFHIQNHLEMVQKVRNESGARRSSFVESAMLFSQCIMSDLRCILFVKQRSVCELVYKYSRDMLFKADMHGNTNYASKIKSYRGGYRKALRRQIECDLFNNKLLGIISTNAMELGVDIGDLDCTLHIGFAGLASLWQQAGRAGRGGADCQSLAIFIAQNSVIDEYIVHHHEMLFNSSHENTVIHPCNKRIFSSHILCSIADEPMDKADIYAFWLRDIHEDDHDEEKDSFRLLVDETIDQLVGDEKIVFNGSIQKWLLSPKYLSILAQKLHEKKEQSLPSDVKEAAQLIDIPNYANNVHPARFVSIRNINEITYSVYAEGNNEKLDEMDAHNAFFHVFPGAVYLNQGKEYLITNLDLKQHRAYGKQVVHSKYYTLSRDRTDILITNNLFTSDYYNKLLHFGRVEVRTKVFAFYKIAKVHCNILDEQQLNLPNLIMSTDAFWIDIPEEIVKTMNEKQMDIISAIHAIEHCVIGLLPLFIKTNCNEFDTECPSPFDSQKRMPRIIVCEKTPFGLGYVQQIVMHKEKEMVMKILQKALQRLQNCSCTESEDTDGCLSCCHSSTCHEYNIVSSRQRAVFLLELLLPVLGHFHLAC